MCGVNLFDWEIVLSDLSVKYFSSSSSYEYEAHFTVHENIKEEKQNQKTWLTH